MQAMQIQSSSEPKPPKVKKFKPQNKEIIKYIMKQQAKIQKYQKSKNWKFPKYLYPYPGNKNSYAPKFIAIEANQNREP